MFKWNVTLTICDLLGREVAKLVDEELTIGEYEKIWYGAALTKAGDVFFIRMQTPEFAGTKSSCASNNFIAFQRDFVLSFSSSFAAR